MTRFLAIDTSGQNYLMQKFMYEYILVLEATGVTL
jgi:hypothetical protein